MTIIALASAKGSPGVTTAALALAWVWPETSPGHRVLVVDADMAGGDMAAGYLQGAGPSPGGLLGLAGERGGVVVGGLWGHVIALDPAGSRSILTGISDPAQARVLSPLWSSLAEVIAQLAEEDPPIDVLLDLGRLGAAHEATVLRERADVTLLTMRSSLTSVASARSAARRLREDHAAINRGGRVRLGCLVVGEGQPYRASEIAAALDLPVVATLARDAQAADVFSAGSPASLRFSRSPLVRSARAATQAIRQVAGPQELAGEASRLPAATFRRAEVRGAST